VGENITSACYRTSFPLRSKPAVNAGVMFSGDIDA